MHKNALVCWWYRAYAREQSPQEREQYEFAEQEAKARRVGLWRETEPIAPWDWRKALCEPRHNLVRKQPIAVI